MLDLTTAVLVCPRVWAGPRLKAARLLVEEVAARSGVRWPLQHHWPADPRPVVALTELPEVPEYAGRALRPRETLRALRAAEAASGMADAPAAAPGEVAVAPWPPLPDGPGRDPGPEGYRIMVRRGPSAAPPGTAAPDGTGQGSAPDAAAQVWLAGRDARGVLFAAGGLLRRLRLSPGRVALPLPPAPGLDGAALDVNTAPRYPIRGHQLGYRPKNNTYDAWSPEQFERYIRDLALFGANTVELLPPRTDDDDRSALMRLPKEEVLARVTAILDDYGLSAGLWYPLMAPDYADPDTADAELAAARGVFARCARLDAVFVPGGDPGHTAPRPLLLFLQRLAAVLRADHPHAQMWLSGQGFPAAALEDLFALLRQRRPAWLTGLVYGPWTRCTLAEMRAALPEQYALRLYPDIAHTMHCQFPVPDWDLAYMDTLGREPINPLPRMQARIFAGLAPGTTGFVTYSEGCNDDCNKFVWTALGWDPDADLGEVLRQYARVLVAPRHADAVAQALGNLERNWEGPLAANAQVDLTLAQLQAVERSTTADERGNWRLQAALYRGYYDAFVRRRLAAAQEREAAARDWLRRAPAVGSATALAGAREALARSERDLAPDLRRRIGELADGLFAGIGMQLSVSRHGASALDRGANLDALDAPLGDGPHLAAALEEVASLPDEGRRLTALAELAGGDAPPPGGHLDDLGTPGGQPHLVGTAPGPDDPSFIRSVTMVPTPAARDGRRPLPRLWRTAAETLYGVPLELRYTGLDPDARYSVRVLYHGRYRAAVRLEAGGRPVHGPLRPSAPPAPVTFPVPAEATGGGALVLTWHLEDGRGIQVAAVWLLPDGEAGDGR